MDRKLLAVLGHPGDEESGVVVIIQDDEGICEALTGEMIDRASLKSYIEQTREYLANLEEALASLDG